MLCVCVLFNSPVSGLLCQDFRRNWIEGISIRKARSRQQWMYL